MAGRGRAAATECRHAWISRLHGRRPASRRPSRLPGRAGEPARDPGPTELWSFDPSGREMLLQWLGPTSAARATFTSLYDAASNRTQLQELDGSVVDYSYNAIYQLQSAGEFASRYPTG